MSVWAASITYLLFARYNLCHAALLQRQTHDMKGPRATKYSKKCLMTKVFSIILNLEQGFSRGIVAGTRLRTGPWVSFSRGRGWEEAKDISPRIFLAFSKTKRGNIRNSPLSLDHFKGLLIHLFRGRGRDETRNFASFFCHFEVKTTPSRASNLDLGSSQLIVLARVCYQELGPKA